MRRDDIDHYLGAGDGDKVKGQAQWDRFDNCTVIMADSIEKAEKKERMDTYPEKRVELHAHTKMSAMDGLNDAKRMVKTAGKMGPQGRCHHRPWSGAGVPGGVACGQGYQGPVRL